MGIFDYLAKHPDAAAVKSQRCWITEAATHSMRAEPREMGDSEIAAPSVIIDPGAAQALA
jgi:hypothetical protein